MSGDLQVCCVQAWSPLGGLCVTMLQWLSAAYICRSNGGRELSVCSLCPCSSLHQANGDAYQVAWQACQLQAGRLISVSFRTWACRLVCLHLTSDTCDVGLRVPESWCLQKLRVELVLAEITRPLRQPSTDRFLIYLKHSRSLTTSMFLSRVGYNQDDTCAGRHPHSSRLSSSPASHLPAALMPASGQLHWQHPIRPLSWPQLMSPAVLPAQAQASLGSLVH